MIVELQRWSPQQSDNPEELEISTAEELAELIQSLNVYDNAILSLGVEDAAAKLIINSNAGIYTATLVLFQDEFFELVGEHEKSGVAEILLAGETITYPRRYFVDLSQVLQVALEFFKNGTVVPNEAFWDKVGDNDAWFKQGLIKSS